MATYYVDATSGDDAKDGLSEANAWKTISKVNGESFSAGDSILFKRGEIWREQLTVPSSGSSGSPITFGAYGSGEDPIISGAVIRNPSSVTVDSSTIHAEKELHFESDLSEFNATVTDGGKMSWNANAAMVGTNGGMQCVMDGDADRKYGSVNISWTSDTIRSRFYFDPNGISTTDAEDIIDIATLATAGASQRGGIKFKVTSGGAYSLCALTKNDSAAPQSTSYYTITDAIHYVEFEVQRASSDVASDGHLKLWIDGDLKETIDNLDIYDLDRPTLWRLGAGCIPDDVPSANTSGTLYFDEALLNYDGDEFGAFSAVSDLYSVNLAADPNIVAIDGVFIEEITSKPGALTAEQWYWDNTNKELYLTTDGTAIENVVVETFSVANCIYIDNKNYIVIDGIHLKGPSQYNGIYGNHGGEALIVQNCTFENFYGKGIEFTGDADDDLSITIGSNIFNDAGRLNQIELNPHADATSSAIISSNTHGCTFYDGTTTKLPASSVMKAMQLTNLDVLSVQNNAIAFPNVTGDTSTILSTGCPNPIVESNTITGGNHGIVIHNATSGGVVRYNKIISSYDDGIWVYGTSTGTQIYYNIVDGSIDDGIDIDSAPNCKIYNNTIINCVDTGIVIRDSSIGVTVKNNICYENGQPGTPTTGDEGGHEILVTADAQTGFTADNNCYYHTTAKVTGNPFNWGGVSYNFSDWKTQTSQDANSINSDSLMTDPANGDFTLQVGSPCVNAGTDVGLTEDYAGNPVDANPDIGAYEYQDIDSPGSASLGMNLDLD